MRIRPGKTVVFVMQSSSATSKSDSAIETLDQLPSNFQAGRAQPEPVKGDVFTDLR